MRPDDFEAGLDDARARDASDPLADLREHFEIPARDGKPLAYLCGHSLGLMPRAARAEVDAELDRWARLGVAGHFDGSRAWYAYHERFAGPLAELVGAEPAEVVAMNSLTTNLHLMLVSFFVPNGARRRILIESGAFPSDRYAVRSHLRFHGLDADRDLIELEPNPRNHLLEPDEMERVLARHYGEVALVLLPGVQFLTGQALDIAAFTDVASKYGALIGFDLAHAIGNVQLSLHDSGADFAVWCSYKYLNAGPGAIGGAFVHRRWHDDDRIPRFEGWWGHDKQRRFDLDLHFSGIPGAEAWQLSNPPILAMAPLSASLALFERAGMSRLREKSIALTAYLERVLADCCGDRIRFLTPRDPDMRGCQVSLAVDLDAGRAAGFADRLAASGVVGDWREPGILRLAPTPLYNRFEDACAAGHAVAAALEAR